MTTGFSGGGGGSGSLREGLHHRGRVPAEGGQAGRRPRRDGGGARGRRGRGRPPEKRRGPGPRGGDRCAGRAGFPLRAQGAANRGPFRAKQRSPGAGGAAGHEPAAPDGPEPGEGAPGALAQGGGARRGGARGRGWGGRGRRHGDAVPEGAGGVSRGPADGGYERARHAAALFLFRLRDRGAGAGDPEHPVGDRGSVCGAATAPALGASGTDPTGTRPAGVRERSLSSTCSGSTSPE